MIIKCLKRWIIFFIFISLISVNAVASDNTYSDGFNSLDTTKWTAMSSDTWGLMDGKLQSTGSRPGLLFEDFYGTQYTCEIDFTANKSRISNYACAGFYFYYYDSASRGTIWVLDDNRGEDYTDSIHIESKGPAFSNTQTYINVSTNSSIELHPNEFHHLKVVRLNKKIYVYLDDKLALTTEFKEDNPEGKVGFDIYESTGYFDNFNLRSISMANASVYINEQKLNYVTPAIPIGSTHTLRLESIENGKAMFSLNKFGTSVGTAVGSEGDTVSLNFENGKEGVNFKLARLFDAGENSAVWLEDIISAETDDLKLAAENVSLNPSYYQGEDLEIDFSVKNLGNIRYDGVPEITIRTDGDSKTINPRLNLEGGGSESLTAVLKAPQKPGTHTLTVSVKTEYSTVEKSVDYQVRVFNPAVTAISSTLKENNGISGTITMDSPYASDLVDWNTDVSIRVYKLVGVGKVETYSMRMLATGKSFDVNIPYSDFYRDDGQYLVTVEVGGMKSTEYFEIIGEDGVYVPSENRIIPTIGSNELYVQLMVLLIGMFAVVSVRNHVHQKHNSIPLNLLSAGCGIVVLVSSFISMNSGMVVIGAMLLGIGLLFTFNRGNPLCSLLTRDSHLHDFAGMIILFLSAVYIALNVPQWSFWVIVGTLIVYSVGLNLYSKVGDGHKKIEDTAYSFTGDE
ncbi:MAG: hypothetical protein SCH66_04585 [Methanolobus sp.]|nr:hypothetical protein [Methanolobus sp.]